MRQGVSSGSLAQRASIIDQPNTACAQTLYVPRFHPPLPSSALIFPPTVRNDPETNLRCGPRRSLHLHHVGPIDDGLDERLEQQRRLPDTYLWIKFQIDGSVE